MHGEIEDGFRDEHDDEKEEEHDECPDGFANDAAYWAWKNG